MASEPSVAVLLNSYRRDPDFPFTQEEAHLLADRLIGLEEQYGTLQAAARHVVAREVQARQLVGCKTEPRLYAAIATLEGALGSNPASRPDVSERGSRLPDRDGSSTRGPDPSAMPRSETSDPASESVGDRGAATSGPSGEPDADSVPATGAAFEREPVQPTPPESTGEAPVPAMSRDSAQADRGVLATDLPHTLPGESDLSGDLVDGDTDE